MSNKENIQSLEVWREQVKKSISNLATYKDSGLSFYSISTTRKLTSNYAPYQTPLRKTYIGVISGSVVFSATQAVLLAHWLDINVVDRVLVDVESKLKFDTLLDYQTLSHFGVYYYYPNFQLESSSLTSICTPALSGHIMYEYKPNDLAVQATWLHLSTHFKDGLKGTRSAIIGAGNIGFKLALALTESGSSVSLVRRNHSKGRKMTEIIESLQQDRTHGTASYFEDANVACEGADIIVGCCNGIAPISEAAIAKMNSNGIIIDVGKGSFSRKVIDYCSIQAISAIRCDITASLEGFLIMLEREREISYDKRGRTEILPNVFAVSGGWIGRKGDIVVDCFNHPCQIFGVADGVGDFIAEPLHKEIAKVNTLRNFLESKC